MAERLPLLQVAAFAGPTSWRRARSPVGIRLSDLDRLSGRLESLAQLVAAAILLTGLLIGSAIAATTGAGKSVFRSDVGDAALAVYVAAAAVAVTSVAVLLWRLVRAEGRRGPRPESFR